MSISGGTAPVLVGEPATGDCPGNRITGDVAGFVFGDLVANKLKGAVVTGGNE